MCTGIPGLGIHSQDRNRSDTVIFTSRCRFSNLSCLLYRPDSENIKRSRFKSGSILRRCSWNNHKPYSFSNFEFWVQIPRLSDSRRTVCPWRRCIRLWRPITGNQSLDFGKSFNYFLGAHNWDRVFVRSPAHCLKMRRDF